MRRAFTGTGPHRQPAGPIKERSALALDITDMGADDGIDVVFQDEVSGRILFETVLADPKSRTLLTFGSSETETFWRCLHTHGHADRARHLVMTARCRFSLLTAAISSKGIGDAGARNASFLRLVEQVLIELLTREPGMTVEVAVTHRNPAFASCINH